MMGKMEVKTSPSGRPRDGRHCDLCGCSQPAVRCDKCGCQIFCLSCDDMYHRHPKRRFHLRKAVDPIAPVPQARPVLPVKVAHLNTTNPGDPSKMPLPPPRKKKSIFSGFRRASPSSDQSSPTLPKKEYSWTDRFGNIKKFMSNRPLPPLPTGEENNGDSQPTENGQSPTTGDLSFIHRRSDERPPQLPQRSPKSPDFPPPNQERDNRFPNATMQTPGQMRNGTTESHASQMNQNHDFSANDDSQWNNRFSNQNGPQVFGTLQRPNHKGFMPPGAPGYPGGMHQSSSATDLHNLQNVEGMPGAAPAPPHYPHYPVNPHMPPHYPYPMYPQFPNYPQYFGQSFANLSNPPTTDGDVSDQSEGISSRHSSKKHPFRKRAKRSQSVMMDRMAYPGQFPYPGPYGPYPGYGPWGAPMPVETPPSPASSIRSLSRSGRNRRRKKMTSEEDDEEFSVSSSPVSRPKSSSSGQKDSPQRAQLATQTSSSEEESDGEMRKRRNKINTIQKRQSEPIRTSSSPAEETSKKSSKLKKSSSKQSDSEPQEIPQNKNERRPSNDSITDYSVPPQSSSQAPSSASSQTWECRHCTYVNPIGNRVCQVCCKSAVTMSESPAAGNSRPSSAAANSPNPNFDSRKGYVSPDKSRESEDDSGKKEKRDMEILNTALDEAEKAQTWKCRHCTYINPIENRICQVCCKSAAPMPESPAAGNSRPSSVAADSPKPNFHFGKGYVTPDKARESEDDSGKKEKRDMEILNTALDEAEKEISRGLEELMKLKDDIDTSIAKDTKTESEENSKPVYKSSGRMRTSILDKLSLNKPQTAKSTASTSTETQAGQSGWTNDRILEARRPSNASSTSDTYNSPVAQSPELERRFPANMQKRDSSCQTQQDSSCQTQQDSLAEYLERKKAAEEAYLGRPINNFGFAYGDRMDMMQSPLPPMYDRFFGGGMGGMMQRSHSRASLFSGRINDPMDFGAGFGYGPAPMYRSISRGSLTGDYPDGRLSGFHNLRKPDFYLSMEELVERRRQDNMRAQGLELVQMIREAEQQGFTADDIQVALTHCGQQSPMEWLQDNWRNMLDSVITLSTNYGNDKKENDIGVLSENEAREALRLHKGNIWAAVTECVEGRQRKYLELSARGKFSRKDIVDALSSSEGDVEIAYAKLTKSTSKPFLMRIWGDGEGAQNQDGAQPMSEDLRDMPQRYQKDDIANSDFLSDEIWSGDDDIEWEEEEYDDERADFEDLQTCHEDLNSGPQEMRTPESDKSDYIDAFALEDRNLSSPSDDIFFVIPEQKPERKKGFLGKLAALRKYSKEQVETVTNVGKDGILLEQSSRLKADAVSQSSASSNEQAKGNGALGALKSTLSAIKDTVTGNSKSDKKLPCAQPEKRTIIVRGQIEHESLSNNSKENVDLTLVKSLEEDLSSEKYEKEFSEILKYRNIPSDTNTEASKDKKDTENILLDKNKSLETNKQPEKSANFNKDFREEKIEDTDTLEDYQINRNNQANMNQNAFEALLLNQTEMQNKMEKNKSQSIAERLKFAKQAQAAKKSNYNSIQSENSILSTSGVTVFTNCKQTSNQEQFEKVDERKKQDVQLQNLTTEDATEVTESKLKEFTPENSTTSGTVNKKSHSRKDVVKEKPQQEENQTLTANAKDISLSPQNGYNTTVTNKTASSSKEASTKTNDSTNISSKSQDKQSGDLPANKEGAEINKVTSYQHKNMSAEPETLEQQTLKGAESYTSTVKGKETRQTSQNKEVVKPVAVAENKRTTLTEVKASKKTNDTGDSEIPKMSETSIQKAGYKTHEAVLSDTRKASDKTSVTVNSEIPKLSEKAVQKVEELQENNLTQVKRIIPKVDNTTPNEIPCDTTKEDDGLKTDINKNPNRFPDDVLHTEQKKLLVQTGTSNITNCKNFEELRDNQHSKIKSEFQTSPNENSTEQEFLVENKQVSMPQLVQGNTENVASSSSKITSHDILRNENNASSQELTRNTAFKNVKNTNDVSPEKAQSDDIFKNEESLKTSSIEKPVTEKEFLSNETKSEKMPNVNQILNNITKIVTETPVTETTVEEKTQQETSLSMLSENQQQTNNGTEKNKSENSISKTFSENTINYPTTLSETSVETEPNGQKLQNSGKVTELVESEQPMSEKSTEIPPLSSQLNSNTIINSDLKESIHVSEDKTASTQEGAKKQPINSEKLKTSNEKDLLSQEQNSILESKNTSNVSEESKQSTELSNTASISDGNAISSTDKENLNIAETSVTSPEEQSPSVLNSERTGQMNETGSNALPNAEASSQIDKANTQIDRLEIRSTNQGDYLQNIVQSKELGSVSTDNMKNFNQLPSSKDETSEQRNDTGSKSSLENSLEIPQSSEQKNDADTKLSLETPSKIPQASEQHNDANLKSNEGLEAPSEILQNSEQNNSTDSESSLETTSVIPQASERKNDGGSKLSQNLETPSQISQNTAESSSDNKNSSVASTSKAKFTARTPREVKSGKLISEKIERLRRSFSKEENDIKLSIRDKSTPKSESAETSSEISSNISDRDLKTDISASSSTSEVSVSQSSYKEAVEDSRNVNDKVKSVQQVKNQTVPENSNPSVVLEAKLQLNEFEQLENEKAPDHQNEASGSQNETGASSEPKLNAEISNNVSVSDASTIIGSTSKGILDVDGTPVTPAIEQTSTSSKTETENYMTDVSLQQTSQNETSQEMMNANQTDDTVINTINTTSSTRNAPDIPFGTVTEQKSTTSSETQPDSTNINTAAEEIPEASVSSSVPELSQHSNVKDDITDSSPSSTGIIEQIQQSNADEHSEAKTSTSNNNDSDDTDIEYSDDESRPSSVTPPNPIDTLRSRFEGLAGVTSGRGTVRPQSPFRRMSLNSRKQVIALERIRDTKADKPWYQQKTETLQKKTQPKRTIKQQLEMERKVRKLVADRVVATYRKAEIVVQLMESNFEEDEAIQAANECSTLEQAISYLQQECQLCAGYFPVSQIVSMTHCQHKACRQCIRAYFTVQIRDRTILDLLCPFCNQPDITDEDVASDYFNHLDIMLKKLVEFEIHELFQRKLRDRVLMKDPNFRWCSQCSSGFIAMPNLTRLVCPDCNAVTCASCRRLWEREHQGISCEAFAALKDASDPEAQAAGLAKMLTEDGIACPSCHFKYALAKGGCMHFRCIQCQHDFCSGCSKPFKMGKKCGVSEFCGKLGLHAHHPRNCLFYLRDKEPADLQKLLDMSDVKYNKDPPEGMEIKSTCQVMEQKETADGMVDDYCGKEVEDGYAGLCRVHYVEYLGQLVNKHKVDPIQIFDSDDLELVLRRANIRLPPKRYREDDTQYRNKLVKLIQEELPLDKMEGS